MSVSLYARPQTNIAPRSTISVSAGVEDADYPAANLANLNPAKPAKLTGGSGAWLIDAGTPVALVVIALIHHNLDPAATLTVEANSADSWGAPPLSQAITIPADDADGYPRNPWVDLRVGRVPDADRTYRYWRIVVADNPDPVAIGEVLPCTELLGFECDLQPGAADKEEHPIIEHRTDHGVSTRYPLGPKWRTWSGELNLTEAANIAAFRALYQAARGRALAFLFIPATPALGDAWFGLLDSTTYAAARLLPDVARFQVGIEELSRGLPL
jgi:hypothetical protein